MNVYYTSQIHIFRIMNDHETHMREMLKGGLEWFDKEKRGRGLFAVKLEGR